MGKLSETAEIETNLFEHTTVKDNFVNPCCFGEDFAAWLRARLQGVAGVTLGDPIMEDYGWGFWVNPAKGAIWVALSYGHDGPVTGPAMWMVTVEWQEINPLRRWFGKPDEAAFRAVAGAVWSAIESEPAIRVTAREAE